MRRHEPENVPRIRFGDIIVIDLRAARRRAVLDALNASHQHRAIALLEDALADEANNPDLLGLLGVALEETGDKDGGADALRRALALPADISIELRNACNLAALLFDARKWEEAGDLLRKGWRWPEGRAPDDKDRSCMAMLARMMHLLKLNDELVAFLLPVAQAWTLDWAALQELARALAALGRTKESLRLVEESRATGLDSNERKAMLAYLYSREGFTESAKKARDAYIAAAPAYLAPKRAGQKATIGVLNPQPAFKHLRYPADGHHFVSNYPGLMPCRMGDRYRFASLFLGSGRAAIEQFRRLEPAVVINNVVSAEYLMGPDHLNGTKRFLASLDAPVVNPPEAAAGCTRQMNALKLAAIPGLVVPKISRFARDVDRLDQLAIEIESAFDYPTIVRTTVDHNAANMTLVRSRQQLCDLLRQHTEPQIYVIEYLGKPRRDEFYRRIRAAFIEGTPIVMRADYSRDWIVRSRNWIDWEVYRSRQDLFADTNAIISRPHERLGAAAMAALEAVGRSIPLDIFGMDFDVDDEGKVIFFETNASMNLFPKAPPEFPYPHEAEAALIDQIDRLLERRRAVRGQPALGLEPGRATA
jgi:tetratricopeptide (TPR) repeat protein